MANLVITSSSVIPDATVTPKQGTAGAAIAAGDVLYKDLADGSKLKLAIATAAASCVFAGIACNSAAIGQQVSYMDSGLLTIGATVALGTIYVVSATAGKICPSEDLVSGNFVTVIGIPTTTAVLSVYPRSSGVAKA